ASTKWQRSKALQPELVRHHQVREIRSSEFESLPHRQTSSRTARLPARTDGGFERLGNLNPDIKNGRRLERSLDRDSRPQIRSRRSLHHDEVRFSRCSMS